MLKMLGAEYLEASSDDELTIPTDELIRAAKEDAARQQEAAARSKQWLEMLTKYKELDDSYNEKKALFDIEKLRLACELKDRLETKETARKILQDAEEAAKSAKKSFTLAESEYTQKEDEGKKLSDTHKAAEQEYLRARKAIKASSRPGNMSSSAEKPQAQPVDTDQSLNRQSDAGTSPRLDIAEQSNKTTTPGSRPQSPLASVTTAQLSMDEHQPPPDPYDYGADPFQSDDEEPLAFRRPSLPQTENRDAPSLPTTESNIPLPKTLRHANQYEIDFDEVFQEGKAKDKYCIVEFPKGANVWYILRCDTCKIHFDTDKDPLLSAGQHLKKKAHGVMRKDGQTAVAACGIRVVHCSAEKAAENNTPLKDATKPDTGSGHIGAANAAGRRRRTLRPSTANQDKPEDESHDVDEPDVEDEPALQPDRATGDQSQVFEGIVDPLPGQVYKAYSTREKSWYAVVVLHIYDLTDLGISGGSILRTVLVDNEEAQIPDCYLVDKDLGQISGFKKEFEHDGPSRQQRSFPCIFLHSRLSIPADGVLELSTIVQADVLAWVDAKDLREYRTDDKDISDHGCATRWKRRIAALTRRRTGSLIDLTSSSDSEDEDFLPSPVRIGAKKSQISTLSGSQATKSSRSDAPPPMTETSASSRGMPTTATPSAVNATKKTVYTAYKVASSPPKPLRATANRANSSAGTQRVPKMAKRTPAGSQWSPPSTPRKRGPGKEAPTPSPKKRKMPEPKPLLPQELETPAAKQLRLIAESRSRHAQPESPLNKTKSPERQGETQKNNGKGPESDKQQSRSGSGAASPENRRFPLGAASSVASPAQTSPTRQQAAEEAQTHTTNGRAATASPQQPNAQGVRNANTQAARSPVQPHASGSSSTQSLENSGDRHKESSSVQIPATQSPLYHALPSRPPPPPEDGQGSLRQLARNLGIPLLRGATGSSMPPPPPPPTQMARTTQPPAPMEIDSPSSFDTSPK